MAKTPEQVRDEFQAAESPLEWLTAEIADYFVADVTDPDTREDILDDLKAQADQSLEQWCTTQVQRDDIVAYTVAIIDADENITMSVFTALPSPLALLELCLAECDEGDRVLVHHRYANDKELAMEATWPFGMDEALRLSAPHGATPRGNEPNTEGDDEPVVMFEMALPSRKVLAAVAASLAAGLWAGRRRR